MCAQIVPAVVKFKLVSSFVVYKEGCSSNQFKTYTTTYTPGQILKIEEVNGIVSPDLLIKFSNTNNTKYSITFPNDTDCYASLMQANKQALFNKELSKPKISHDVNSVYFQLAIPVSPLFPCMEWLVGNPSFPSS